MAMAQRVLQPEEGTGLREGDSGLRSVERQGRHFTDGPVTHMTAGFFKCDAKSPPIPAWHLHVSCATRTQGVFIPDIANHHFGRWLRLVHRSGFGRMRGVTEVQSDCSNGQTVNPSYEQLCTGMSDYTEVVPMSNYPVLMNET